MVTTGCVLRHGRQRGFAYMALLIFIAILGVGLAATGEVWRTVRQRAKERELLYVGEQFRRAIGRYYEGTPGMAKRFPRKLEDLLEDKRYPNVQRYLRQLYPDPITNQAEWGLVEATDGGIAGVYSLSQEAPLKIANFGGQRVRNADDGRYSGWRFIYTPAAAPTPAAAAPSPLASRATLPTH